MARITKIIDQEPLVRAEKVSEFLGGLPGQTLANWRSAGKGPKFYRVGKHVMYRLSDVTAWLEEERARVMGASA